MDGLSWIAPVVYETLRRRANASEAEHETDDKDEEIEQQVQNPGQKRDQSPAG